MDFTKVPYLHSAIKLVLNIPPCLNSGVPSNWRQNLESEKDYSLLFERYESEILARQTKVVDNLANMMTQSPSALLCMEYEHNHCHRSKLALQISNLNRLTVHELNRAA